jgi:hypothetical protein
VFQQLIKLCFDVFFRQITVSGTAVHTFRQLRNDRFCFATQTLD